MTISRHLKKCSSLKVTSTSSPSPQESRTGLALWWQNRTQSVCLFVQTAEMVAMTHVEFDGQRPVELEIPSCTFVLLEIPMCQEIPSRYQAAPQGPRIPPKPSKYPSECHNGIQAKSGTIDKPTIKDVKTNYLYTITMLSSLQFTTMWHLNISLSKSTWFNNQHDHRHHYITERCRWTPLH